MRRLAVIIFVGLGGVFSLPAFAASSDPVEIIKGFSTFQQIDVGRLANGELLAERGALMDFPNGISTETCFVVPLAAEETAKRLQTWDPTPHADLKVFAFHPIHAPAQLTDFQALDFKNGQKPVRWLVDKTIAAGPGKTDLNLGQVEAEELAGCAKKQPDPAAVGGCWSKLLLARATAFQQKGVAGVLPYEFGGQSVSPVEQLRSMLREQLAISHEFLPLLKKIGLNGSEAESSLPAFHYWSLFDADYKGTINLGATYSLPDGDRCLVADVEYYVSGNYFSSVTLYDVWTVQVAGKAVSLVWRGDYFAAPTLRFAKGTERIAYGALMLQDIKKEIHDFLDDARAKR